MKSDSKTEIKKIIVQMGKKEVTVSVDEAKKLFKCLEELFGEKIVNHYHENYYKKYWDYTPYWGHGNSVLCANDSTASLTYKAEDNTALLAIS